MSDAAINGNGNQPWWVRTLQYVGLPAFACGCVALALYWTIEWERSVMLPTIEKNTEAIQSQNEINRSLRPILEQLNIKTNREFSK